MGSVISLINWCIIFYNSASIFCCRFLFCSQLQELHKRSSSLVRCAALICVWSFSPYSCRAFKAPFYIGMVVPFVIVYVFNWVVFFVIIASLIRKSFSSTLKDAKKDNKSRSMLKQQFIITITLSVLFGLGWGIGLLATEDIYSNKTVRDIFAALFVLMTAFHGLFIFIMHCLRSKDARSVWERLFFGMTGKDFSEFSSSTFNQIHQRQRPVGSSVSSTARKTSATGPFSPPEEGGTFSFSETKELEDSDSQGTLKFYVKKKEAEQELEPRYAVLPPKELAVQSETTLTKSFPDDKVNEKEKLRQEEEKAYNAYHNQD